VIFSPWSLVSTLAAILAFALLLYVRRRPLQPELRSSIVASLVGVLLFCVGDVASMMVTTVGGDRLAGNVIYGGLALTSSGFWMIAVRTAQLQGIPLRVAGSRVAWLPPLWLGLLWLSALADPRHHLARRIDARRRWRVRGHVVAVAFPAAILAQQLCLQ